MATPIYDLISNASLGLISVGNAQIKKERHHELVLPVKASATTNFLKFLDPQFSCYNIPLGEAPTRKKDQASKQNNILIPILPLCYTTPDCDPINARSPRAGGYLYIYIGDYLWRELEVFKDGKFRDINLHQYQGKDLRPATVEQDTRILIPHMVDGKENTVTMCYSEIQWSWARINTMGGMDPDDFRLDVDTPPTLASDMNISKATAAKNRAARMQELNLSGYLTGFPNTAATGNKARVENSNNPTSSLYYLSLHKKSEIPIVYLHDPLGIALDNTKKYFNAHAKLFSEVEQIKTQEHFKTAVITYQSFFNEDLWEQGMEEGAGSSSLLDDDDDPGFEQSDPNSVVFRKSAGTLDKDYIKKYLKVDSRKPLRQKIRESKKQHVEFLDAKFGGKDLTATNPDFVSVNDALLDYAELPPPSYVVLWSAVNSLISFLNYDPSILDAALDVPQDQDRLKKTEDPGCLYMESLLKPAHPLHAVLFPKKADVDEFVKDYNIDGKKVEVPNGTGDFRPIAFATSFTTQFNKSVGSWVYFESTLKQLDKSLSDFATAFKTQWTQSLQQTTSYDANVIIRLFKAANLSELDGLHILIKDQPLQGVTPMTGNVTVLSTMMTSIQSKSFSRQKMKNGINVVDPKTSKIVGYLDPHQVPNFKGTPMDITLEKFNDLFTKAEGSTKTARMQLTVVSSSSKYATEWHANFSGSITETIEVEKTPSGIKFAGKYLPPVFAVLDMFNLVAAVGEARKTKSLKDRFKAILSFVGLAQSSVVASVALIGEAQTGQLMKVGLGLGNVNTLKEVVKMNTLEKFALSVEENTLKAFGRNIKILDAAGAALAGAGALMSTWDMTDAIIADDDDAAVAYGVQALAMSGLAITGFVEAGAIALGLGPIGWAFLAVGLLAGIFATILTDSEIEKWTKHSPFAKNVEERCFADFGTESIDEDGNDIQICKPHATLEALMSMLMKPGVTLKKGKKENQVVVELIAPGFEVGKSTLEIYTTIQKRYSRATTNKDKYQQPATPSLAEIIENKLGIAIGIKYTYDIPTDGRYEVYTRARHITAEQIYLPKQTKVTVVKQIDSKLVPGKRIADPTQKPIVSTTSSLDIHPNDPNWVYSKPFNLTMKA